MAAQKLGQLIEPITKAYLQREAAEGVKADR